MTVTKTTLFAALILAGATSLAQANSEVSRELAAQTAPTIQGQGLTRAQVKAEFLAAQKAGELIAGESGEKLNELYPAEYPKRAVAVAPVARETVKPQLADARHSAAAPEYFGN